MKMKLLVNDVPAIGTPDRAQYAVLWVVLAGRVFGQFRSFVWSGSHFAYNFTSGHLMKMKLLVTDVRPIGSPGRAESAILGVVLPGRVFGQFRTYLSPLSHFFV